MIDSGNDIDESAGSRPQGTQLQQSPTIVHDMSDYSNLQGYTSGHPSASPSDSAYNTQSTGVQMGDLFGEFGYPRFNIAPPSNAGWQGSYQNDSNDFLFGNWAASNMILPLQMSQSDAGVVMSLQDPDSLPSHITKSTEATSAKLDSSLENFGLGIPSALVHELQVILSS